MKLALFALAAATAFAQAPYKTQIDKAAIEQYLRHMELWIPQVGVAIDDPKPAAYLPGFSELTIHLSYNGQGKDEKYLVSSDGKHIVKGEAFDLTKNPFQANLDRLKTAKQPSYGSPTATVEAVVFGDFQCPLCKAEAEIMRGVLVRTFGDKVRVVFKDFPLEAIHPWARAGSIAGRCVYRQGEAAFWAYHDWIYKDQNQITGDNLLAQVQKWAGSNGVDPIQLSRCIEGKETDSEVLANMADGRALGVDATPTTFLNGRKLVGTMQWELLQQLLTMELDRQTQLAKK